MRKITRSKSFQPTITSLRKEIDRMDKAMVNTIAKRLIIVQKIGILKKEKNLNVKDLKREEKLKKLHEQWAKKYRIQPKTIHKIFDLLINKSRELQK
jgi:chorismate mutase